MKIMSIVKSFSFPDGEIRGDMFYIKHNSDCFTVIDCFLKENEHNRNCRTDDILCEIQRESKDRIFRFISTHPDNDHIAGIEMLHKQMNIINFYAVANNRKPNQSDVSLSCYQELLRKYNFALYRDVKRAWLNETYNGRYGCGINFLWPDVNNEKFKKALKAVENNQQINNICPIFTYSVKNGATFMWMGDLETDMQQEFYNLYKDSIEPIDILFQPHHGRYSGRVPRELLEKLNPKLIIIGNTPSEHIDYGDSRMTITQNTAGDITFLCEERYVHIFTANTISNPPLGLVKVFEYKDGKGYIGSLKV